ncbi:MAG: hypothetical protein LBG72_07305 [Spirochaetaceae bacterium]|jgi:hypothetical protein|nr:hypothetical protein [Spirochaetaceae bacterium]
MLEIINKFKKLSKFNLFLIFLSPSLVLVCILVFSVLPPREQETEYNKTFESLQNRFDGQIKILSEKIEELETELQLLRYEISIKQIERSDEDIINMVKNTIDAKTGKPYSNTIQTTIEEGAKKNTQYKWSIDYKPEHGIYMASFVDTVEERGKFWEVDLNNKTVRSITDNWILKLKYGITPLRDDKLFTLSSIDEEEVYTNEYNGYRYSYYSSYTNEGIVYKISGYIKNNTGKSITSGKLGANLVVVYSDQKVIEEKDYEVNFSKPSTSDPWFPNRTREFTITTKPYDIIYKDYNPVRAVCFLTLEAEDLLGFEYSGAFVQRDVKRLFEKL